MKRARRLASVLAVLAAAGCPPPGDVPGPGDQPPPAAPGGAGTGGGADPGRPETPGTPGAAAPAGAPAAPPSPGDPAKVVYERRRGGASSARCPACGAVQAKDAASCPSCGQALSSWRHEETCVRCAGEGRCDRCGDDRICLTCDGDGKCAACGGTGDVRGARCPECAGNKQCTACRGDGRRENSARDFLPTEGWLPGACATCVDASGLCPECGSTGKDRAGGVCFTCTGSGVCPDCAGEGVCGWCASDGECPQCEGGGVLVRNGAPRAADERVRRVRTAAGSVVTGRIQGPPGPQGVRIVADEKGRAVPTTLPAAQVDPVSWLLAVRDFPPGWDGRTAADPAAAAKFRRDLAAAASDAGAWSVAFESLRQALAVDPSRAQDARVQITDTETRRAESWTRRAEEAARNGDRDRAIALLEMAAFRARGTAVATRASLQVLGLRKDREAEAAKMDEAERVRRTTDARGAADRAAGRVRVRLDRAARLLARAAGAAPSDDSADRTFARAEASAWTARRIVETTLARTPLADAPWPAEPAALVTESRRLSVSVLEAWATHAVAGGRFALGARLARRGAALDPQREILANLLAQAESGLARDGVLQASPAPSNR